MCETKVGSNFISENTGLKLREIILLEKLSRYVIIEIRFTDYKNHVSYVVLFRYLLIQYYSDKTYCYVNLATEKSIFFVAFYYGFL